MGWLMNMFHESGRLSSRLARPCFFTAGRFSPRPGPSGRSIRGTFGKEDEAIFITASSTLVMNIVLFLFAVRSPGSLLP